MLQRNYENRRIVLQLDPFQVAFQFGSVIGESHGEFKCSRQARLVNDRPASTEWTGGRSASSDIDMFRNSNAPPFGLILPGPSILDDCSLDSLLSRSKA